MKLTENFKGESCPPSPTTHFQGDSLRRPWRLLEGQKVVWLCQVTKRERQGDTLTSIPSKYRKFENVFVVADIDGEVTDGEVSDYAKYIDMMNVIALLAQVVVTALL